MSILKLYFSETYFPETEEISVYTEIMNSDMEIIEQFSLSINSVKEININFGNYIIQNHFPSGKVVTVMESVMENRTYDVKLQSIQFRNKQLTWQEFLGNIPMNKKEKKFSKDCSIWQRLWSYDKESKEWQILETSNWDITRLTRDEKFIYYQLKVPQGIKKLHFLQLGGKQIPYRAKAMAAGCDEHEIKPVELPRLLAKIERHLGESFAR